MAQFEQVEDITINSPLKKTVIAVIITIFVLCIWTFVSQQSKEPQIVKDVKLLNQINLDDANDLLIKREAEALIKKRSETKAKLLERINFEN